MLYRADRYTHTGNVKFLDDKTNKYQQVYSTIKKKYITIARWNECSEFASQSSNTERKNHSQKSELIGLLGIMIKSISDLIKIDIKTPMDLELVMIMIVRTQMFSVYFSVYVWTCVCVCVE